MRQSKQYKRLAGKEATRQIEMPEKMSGLSAVSYWTIEEAEKYNKSTSIQKTQAVMTQRIMTSLELPPKSVVLDAGCGTGFGMQVIEQFGCVPIGLDVSQEMLKLAKSKGFKLLVRGDWQNLPFKENAFDALTSLSTLQWISGKTPDDISDQYRKVAKESYRILKNRGKAGIQFYPATPAEFEMVKKAFKSAAFGGHVIEEGEGKKLKHYLILQKKW